MFCFNWINLARLEFFCFLQVAAHILLLFCSMPFFDVHHLPVHLKLCFCGCCKMPFLFHCYCIHCDCFASIKSATTTLKHRVSASQTIAYLWKKGKKPKRFIFVYFQKLNRKSTDVSEKEQNQNGIKRNSNTNRTDQISLASVSYHLSAIGSESSTLYVTRWKSLVRSFTALTHRNTRQKYTQTRSDGAHFWAILAHLQIRSICFSFSRTVNLILMQFCDALCVCVLLGWANL